jgi:hypothetical protein
MSSPATNVRVPVIYESKSTAKERKTKKKSSINALNEPVAKKD